MKISKDVQLATQQLLTQLKRAENPYAQGAQGDQAIPDIEVADLSEGSKQALALLKTTGYPVDQQTQQTISQFMDQAPGTVKEKLEALASALAKDIPLKTEALNALRIAKTGSLADYLRPAAQPSKRDVRSSGSTEKSPPESPKSAEKRQATLNQLDVLLEALMEALSTEKGDKSVNYVDKSVFSGGKVGIIQQRSVDNMRTEVAHSASRSAENASISPQSLSAFDEGLMDSVGVPSNESSGQMVDSGLFKHAANTKDFKRNGSSAGGDFESALTEADDSAAWEVGESSQEALESLSGELSEALEALAELAEAIAPEDLISRTGLGDQARMLLERKITPRLMAVQSEFTARVKAIAAQLAQGVEQGLASGTKALSHQERVAQLDKTIDQLDQLVMKSEASLFLSLKGEKRLIVLSAQVEAAKQQLMRGGLAAAEGIVKDVVKVLSEMRLEPTLKRVLGLPSFGAAKDFEGLSKAYLAGNDRFAHSEKSPAGILNFLRKLGLNHEPEVYQKAFGADSSVDPTGQSLKEKLVKLTQLANQGSGPNSDQSAKDAISHITGQQLGNRLVDKPQLQQMSFAIPVAQGGVTQQMQVLIQTPQDRLKADWKTFDMVFMLSTQSVGDVGIKVRSVDLKLSVEVINDSVEREALFRPLVSALMEDLGEMGFTATRVTFKGWHGKDGAEGPAKAQGATKVQDVAKEPNKDLREGGFDIKV